MQVAGPRGLHDALAKVDQATAARLHQMGCPMIQGYWLSRPMPGDAALDYVIDHKGAIPPPRPRRRRSDAA